LKKPGRSSERPGFFVPAWRHHAFAKTIDP